MERQYTFPCLRPWIITPKLPTRTSFAWVCFWLGYLCSFSSFPRRSRLLEHLFRWRTTSQEWALWLVDLRKYWRRLGLSSPSALKSLRSSCCSEPCPAVTPFEPSFRLLPFAV